MRFSIFLRWRINARISCLIVGGLLLRTGEPFLTCLEILSKGEGSELQALGAAVGFVRQAGKAARWTPGLQ